MAKASYLIIESNPSGHRLHYVAMLANEALTRGNDVYFGFTQRVVESEELKVLLPGLELVPIVPIARTSLHEITLALTEVGADHVIVPDGDGTAFELAMMKKWGPSATITLLVLRERAQRKRVVDPTLSLRNLLKRYLFLIASGRQGVRVVRLKPAGWAATQNERIAIDPVQLDTAMTKEEIAARFGLSSDLFWFAVLGAVSQRKNLHLVIPAIRKSERPIGLVVAGKIDPVVKSYLNHYADSRRIVVHDRMLEDSELDGLVRYSDCIILAHTNEGPSGLFGKALAAGTRILAAGANSLREDVRRNPAASLWVGLTSEQLALGIERTVQAPSCNPLSGLGKDQFLDALL